MRVNYAIVFVQDMSRSVAFYRDVLGLSLRFETPEWTEFATEGATLALHPAAADGGGAQQSAPGSCRPGFDVPDLAAFHAKMEAAGVACAQEPKDVFGTSIAQYLDPDGLQISVSQAR